MAYQTVNPYTNEVVKEYPDATDQQLEDALQEGHELYQTFRTQDVTERADMLRQVAAKIRENSDELAHMATTEMGKLLPEAEGEVELTAIIAEWYADNGAEMLASEEIETGANRYCGSTLSIDWCDYDGCKRGTSPYYQIMRVFAPEKLYGR